MKRLKIKLFFLQYMKIITITLIAIMILFIIKKPINISITNNPNKIGVYGTLLGAIVGGFFSLIGSIYVNNRIIKSNFEIKRKNIIYKPLYDELIETKNIIENENKYPKYILRYKTNQNGRRFPEITAWEEISSSTRNLDTPKILMTQYDKYLNAIKAYEETYENVDNIISEIITDVLKKKIKLNLKHIVLINELSSQVLDKSLNKEALIKYYKNEITKPVTDKKWDNIIKTIFDNCEKIEQVIETRKKFQDWIDIQNDTIELLKLLIKEVNIKYEKQKD